MASPENLTARGKPPSILIVDDEIQMAEMLADGLVDHGYAAIALASSQQAVARLELESFDALVTDLRMPKVDGLELLARARRAAPSMPVIVMTAYGAIDSAMESIRQGAFHYLTKPFKLEELLVFLDRAIENVRIRSEATALRKALRERQVSPGIIGTSDALEEVLSVVERVARADVPVLITGETGTGKSLLARTIHGQSERASGPFVTVNCAALPEALLESELFGHVKGAFTGATRDRSGLLVEASSGTLFLDEIAEMSPSLQAKLLDVIERLHIRAVGGTQERQVDVRIIAATHRDLAERVRAGAFREDLRYRLDLVPIELPPLRRRREDLPLLAEHFLQEARARHPSSPVERLGRDALDRMTEYDWPGNVRELAHAVERMVLLGRSPELTIADLPPVVRSSPPPNAPTFTGHVLPIREVQRRYAAWALDQLGGHRTRTAERLDVDLKTLAKWLSESDPPRDSG
jgi:two-component system, NtrC family, response regulator HydG